MNILRRTKKILENITAYFASITLLLLVFVSFLQVILRNIFSIAFNFLEIIMRNTFLWLTFYGALLVSLRSKHLSIDILPIFLERGKKYKLKRGLDIFVNIFSGIICTILTYLSIKFIIMEIESGSYVGNMLPAWTVEIIIPIGFFLLSITFFLNIFDK